MSRPVAELMGQSVTLLSSHTSLTFDQIFYGPLLDLDVQKAKCVQTVFDVGTNLVIETIRFPVITPKGDGDSLSKPVELKPYTTHCIHDTGIVNSLGDDASLLGSEHQIRVSGGSKRITDYQEGHVIGITAFKDLVGLLFNLKEV